MPFVVAANVNTSLEILVAETTVVASMSSAVSGFLAPAPPPIGSMRGLNKPSDIQNAPNRLQQTSSIGMAHPTFRSDFNVNLRYFFVRFGFFIYLFYCQFIQFDSVCNFCYFNFSLDFFPRKNSIFDWKSQSSC